VGKTGRREREREKERGREGERDNMRHNRSDRGEEEWLYGTMGVVSCEWK
jgi:hypothetical protein